MTDQTADAEAAERYPLHEKLRQNSAVAKLVSDLFDKLHEKGIYLAQFDKSDDGLGDDSLIFARMTGEQFVGLALDIDPQALSAEKELMYADLRKANDS